MMACVDALCRAAHGRCRHGVHELRASATAGREQTLSAWEWCTAVCKMGNGLRRGRVVSHLHRAAWLLLLGLGLGGAAAARSGAVCRRRPRLVLEPDHDVAVRKVEVGVRLQACRTTNDQRTDPPDGYDQMVRRPAMPLLPSSFHVTTRYDPTSGRGRREQQLRVRT